MALLKTPFSRGLNTDLAVNHLPSGTARTARNVVLEGTELQGRLGFDEWKVASPGAAGAGILNIAVVQFAERKYKNVTVAAYAYGEVYAVVKATDGYLYYSRIWDGSAATAISWTKIVDQWGSPGHSLTDPGRFFFAEDRLYYFDKGGATKWNPGTYYKPGSTYHATAAISFGDGAAATAWKAGIQCTTGMVFAAASDGPMKGSYRPTTLKKNSITGALSIYATPSDTAIDVDPYISEGALSSVAGQWAACRDSAADDDYEWDTAVVLNTMGSTEVRFDKEHVSHQYYRAVEVARNSNTEVGVSKGDEAVRAQNNNRTFPNNGGVPPACSHACFNGTRAVYGNTYNSSGVLAPGQIMYSLPGQPAMVPGDQTYTVGTIDVTTVTPRPWRGFLTTATSGRITGIGHVGRNFLVFTELDCYYLSPSEKDGRLYAVKSQLGIGCASARGVVSTQGGVHAIGVDTWVWGRRDGLRNHARDRFSNLLLEIPAAQRANSVVAPYGFRNEVWAAVARENYDCDYIMAYDGAATTYQAVASTSSNANQTYNYQLFSDTPHASDVVYFGWAATATSLTVAVNRPAAYTGSDVIEWEYYDSDESDWVALTVAATADTTNPDTKDGSKPFVDDGTLTFSISGTWGTTTINSQSAYWIRAKVATGKAASMTRGPILTAAGPSRILIFDEARGEMTSVMDPRNLLGATIGAMCECRLPNGVAKMLIGLSDGRTLVWPSVDATNAYADHQSTNYYNYSTYWRGFIGQERRAREMVFTKPGMAIHMADNARRVHIACAALATGGDAVTVAVAQPVIDANAVTWQQIEYYPYTQGTLVQVTIETTASDLAAGENKPNSPNWGVIDLLLTTKSAG